MYLWEIYIFPGSVYLFCCSQICGPILGISCPQTHECGNWDWSHAIPRKGILYINGIFVAVWSFWQLSFTNQFIVLKTFLVKLIATQKSIFLLLVILYAKIFFASKFFITLSWVLVGAGRNCLVGTGNSLVRHMHGRGAKLLRKNNFSIFYLFFTLWSLISSILMS